MQWINVKERLPERSKYTLNTSVSVLVWDTWGQISSNTDYNGTRRGYYHFDKQRWCFSPEDGITDFVSHWQPLPVPPTKD